MVSTSKKIGTYSAILSVTEVGLGSIFHALHIPFAGHLLSLNQGFVLVHANKNQENLSATISNVAAILKSLSPAGKRLTPMLAISAQGYLFSVGARLLGSNPAGHLLAITLLSLWAFLQPVLIHLLVFGSTLVASYQFLLENINKHLGIKEELLLLLLLGAVLVKLILAWTIVVATYFVSEKEQQNILEKIERIGIKSGQALTNKNSRRSGLKQIFNPLFLLSFAVTGFFFCFSESAGATQLWTLFRPLAAMLIIHFGFQFLPVEKWVGRLRARPKSAFASALVFAISVLRNPLYREPLKAEHKY